MLPHPLHVFLLSAGLFLASLHHTPPCSAAADGGDTLMAGQALALGDKLVSGDGKFALGFFQVQAPTSISNSTTTTTTIPGWYLGIWFNKIPVFTTAWVANRENPITAADLINHSAHLKISRDGNLAIILNSTASSESMIWSTHIIVNRTTGTSTNTSALLMNNGNLVLMAENPPSSSVHVVLWQSFDYPADVGLPGAKLGRNKITGLNRLFISKKSLTDLGLGSYTIELGTNGVLFIKRRRPSLVYWSWSSGQLAYTLVPLLNELLDMDPRTKGLLKASYVHNNEEEYFTYTSHDESISAFVYMDITGQVKLKVWSRPKQSWQTIYAEPSDPCSLRDACGPFTVCNGNSVPFCDCMEGFSPRSPQDWDAGDPIRGCVRSTPLDCRSSNLQDTSPEGMFHTIARVTMPSDPESVDDASTRSKCEQGCLANCSCTAYSYNGNRCSVWHGELRNVNHNDGIDDSSEDVLYLRLAARDLQSIRRNTKRKPRVVAMVSTVGF
uniref:non-specific serine/threonine protein kinase n=1 Tax=Oryza brachyantha TaxID=4533 RepID=J3MID2_ORYBR